MGSRQHRNHGAFNISAMQRSCVCLTASNKKNKQTTNTSDSFQRSGGQKRDLLAERFLQNHDAGKEGTALFEDLPKNMPERMAKQAREMSVVSDHEAPPVWFPSGSFGVGTVCLGTAYAHCLTVRRVFGT